MDAMEAQARQQWRNLPADVRAACGEAPARVVTAHPAAVPAGYTDFRVAGRALLGWMGPLNGAVPGHLLTYFWDSASGRVSGAAVDTAQVWVQSEAEAIAFLQAN